MSHVTYEGMRGEQYVYHTLQHTLQNTPHHTHLKPDTWETMTAVILATAGERLVAGNTQFNTQDDTQSATRTLQHTLQRTQHHTRMKSGFQ